MSKVSSINPFTGEPTGSHDISMLDDLIATQNAVSSVQGRWARCTVDERVDVLASALTYFENKKETISADITSSMGKPILQAENEVEALLQRGRFLLSAASDALAPVMVRNDAEFEMRIEHEALGTVLIAAPWNYPLLTAINGVMAALLCGNGVLLKHSSLTLVIGDHFERAFGHLSGFEGLLAHIVADHETTAALIQGGLVDHVVFTGSVRGGTEVYKSVAQNFIRCNLELGGKDGAYVAADANIQQAAESLVDGAMYNAGQSCCGIERVYVHESVYEDFWSACRRLVSAYRLGDPANSETTMGPLATPEAADLLVRQIDDALLKGARIELGGRVVKIDQGTFFEPTLLTDVNHTMLVMQDENFGPILPVMCVADDDEATKYINDSRYGLTSAIFTSDQQRAEKFAALSNTGTVFMNRCDYLDPALPWTGVKASGFGSSLSDFGFYELTRRKSIHFRRGGDT